MLVSTPRGFTTLTTYGMWLYLPVASRQIMEDKLNALDLEEQVNVERGRGIDPSILQPHFVHAFGKFAELLPHL